MIGLPLGKQRGVGLGDEGVAGDEGGLIANRVSLAILRDSRASTNALASGRDVLGGAAAGSKNISAWHLWQTI